ncbi:MAG: hypothetical protein EBT50_08745, partial [Verrucomicrobia bacterium]|nr:hypothetical protein [Verrucomicrobiota bacterium]
MMESEFFLNFYSNRKKTAGSKSGNLFHPFVLRLGIAVWILGALEVCSPLASAVTVDVASGEQGVGTDLTTGSDGLTKTGSGTLQIWSAQPYTGAT